MKRYTYRKKIHVVPFGQLNGCFDSEVQESRHRTWRKRTRGTKTARCSSSPNQIMSDNDNENEIKRIGKAQGGPHDFSNLFLLTPFLIDA